jgi:5,10-methylene-tetrahydrofolate dehydrogenase/methenyl tetrahydrofolate cyclohydrolase
VTSTGISFLKRTDPTINGILVQLPLPPHIDENFVLDRIGQVKDVDGLHPLNVAQLANTKTHAPGRAAWSFDSINFHVSCTPQGCIELLDRSGVVIEGANAVVLGRSNIVGIPVALLLMQRNATVTIAHSRTKNIEDVVRAADIVVAAVGRTEMVKGSWIKPGATVIDVGINSKDDPSDKRGERLKYALTLHEDGWLIFFRFGRANYDMKQVTAWSVTLISIAQEKSLAWSPR